VALDSRARYDADAAAYARLWAPVLAPAARPLLDRLDLDRAEVIVEIGCGTGGLLAELRAAAPRAMVVGVDASFGMLATHRDRRGLVQGDTQRLPLRDGCAAALVTAFVLHHVIDPPAAYAEMARALRPGGTLAVAAWADGEGWPAWDAAESAYDEVGAPPVESAPVSGERTGSLDRLAALAAAAGLDTTAAECDRLHWRPSVDELITVWSSLGPLGRRYAALGEEARQRWRAQTRTRLLALPPEAVAPRHVVQRAWARRP
jgi:SAM-dependent methyltransferase